MPLSPQQYAERASRQARQGRTEAASGIYLDRAALLIPQAQHSFSSKIAHDPRRRNRMRALFEVALDAGTKNIGDIESGDRILTSAMKWSTAFDGDDADHAASLIWMPEPQAIFTKTNSIFGRYALFDDRILTKKKSGGLTDMQSLTLYVGYVWNFTEGFPLPPEFEDEAITELAMLLITDAAA